MSGSQPMFQFTRCHRDTTAGCHGEVLDWVPVGANNHQVSEEGRGSSSSERFPAVISGLRAMQREALKFKTGPDKTKREAGKIRERADTGERRNATAFVESWLRS